MSLRVVFASATGAVYDAGTYAEVRLTTDTLYGLPEHRVLARDVNHRWITPKGEYQRIDVEASVKIYFEDNGVVSDWHGTYRHFSSADGIGYADRQVLAFADNTAKKWYAVPTDSRWAILVVTAA